MCESRSPCPDTSQNQTLRRRVQENLALRAGDKAGFRQQQRLLWETNKGHLVGQATRGGQQHEAFFTSSLPQVHLDRFGFAIHCFCNSFTQMRTSNP